MESLDLKSQVSNINYLDWKDRPEQLKKKVDSAFYSIANNSSSDWKVYNGSSCYGILDISIWDLAKKVAAEASKEQTDIYLLDIGSGNFQWCDAIARLCVNEEIKGKHFHVFGVRGEGGEESIEKHSCCTVYKLTKFKVEEIFSEFQNRKLLKGIKFHIITSHWCFRHLADPVGTFVQTYDLLKAEMGYLLMDGFFFGLDENKCDSQLARILLFRLLKMTGEPFLLQPWKIDANIGRFILKRTAVTDCKLPLSYSGVLHERLFQESWRIGSATLTQFQSHGPHLKVGASLKDGNSSLLQGTTGAQSFSLFEWLYKSQLIPESFVFWDAEMRQQIAVQPKASALADPWDLSCYQGHAIFEDVN